MVRPIAWFGFSLELPAHLFSLTICVMFLFLFCFVLFLVLLLFSSFEVVFVEL